MSLAFLAKKSWHTTNLKNVEKVWIAEEKHAQEKKKLSELKKQIEEERQIQELRELQAKTGDGPAKVQGRVDWLYEGPMTHAPSTEEYLLGKEFKEKDYVSDLKKLESQPGSLFTQAPAVDDSFSRLHEDPMLLIRKQQQDVQKNILKNPIKMKRIKEKVELELYERKMKKKARKEAKKEIKRQKKLEKFSEDKGNKHSRNLPPKRSSSRKRSRSPRRSRSKERPSDMQSRKRGYSRERSRDRNHSSERLKRRSNSHEPPRRRSNSNDCPRKRSGSNERPGKRHFRPSSSSTQAKHKDKVERIPGRGHHGYSSGKNVEFKKSRDSRRSRSKSVENLVDITRPNFKDGSDRIDDSRISSEFSSRNEKASKKYGLISAERAAICANRDKSSLGPNTSFLQLARDKKAKEKEDVKAKLKKGSIELSEEEKTRRLMEMQADANRREKLITERGQKKEAEPIEEQKNPKFLSQLQTDAYMGSEEGMEERIRRNRHYVQRQTDPSNFLKKD